MALFELGQGTKPRLAELELVDWERGFTHVQMLISPAVERCER